MWWGGRFSLEARLGEGIGGEVRKNVVLAMRIRRRVRRHRLNPLKRISLKNRRAQIQPWLLHRGFLEHLVDEPRVRDVIRQQADRVLDAVVAVLAAEVGVAETGGCGESGVGNCGGVVEDGVEGEEGGGVGGGGGGGADVVDCEDYDGLLGGG